LERRGGGAAVGRTPVAAGSSKRYASKMKVTLI
jgi:hypothetical protein